MDSFEEIVEKAKKASREKILKFITELYDVDESLFEHLWRVPVLAPYEVDSVIDDSLSEEMKERVLEILDEKVTEQMGEEEIGCFIDLEFIKDELEPEELEEWKGKLREGEILNEYNAIILYNDFAIKKEMRKKQKTSNICQEELEKRVEKVLQETIIHETIHLNVNCIVDEMFIDEYILGELNKSEYSFSEELDISDTVNGAEHEYEEREDYLAIMNEWSDRNEVMVEAVTRMIKYYQTGDSIEDCLYKVLANRGNQTIYPGINDVQVLATYVLFSEELTEWMIFGAYQEQRENKLQQKIIEVFGDSDETPSNKKVFEGIEKYLKTLEEPLSDKKIEMLEMLGMKRTIKKDEIEVVATSEKAMGALEESLADIAELKKNLRGDGTKEK